MNKCSQILFVLFYFLSDAFSGPTNLQVSDETTDSVRFQWTAAKGPVTGYVIQYTPLSGLGQPVTGGLRQVRVMINAILLLYEKC